tara:strand:- start:878 stop:1225 length:348 start_codon:yes stop_codon:yes gene_type:complete
MNQDALVSLPPEMQARIAAIMSGQPADATPHQAAIAPPQAPEAPAPVARPPSLMDHVIALRGEVQELRQQVAASAQVTEAVGQAVGAIYEMFSPSQNYAYGGTANEETYTDQPDY